SRDAPPHTKYTRFDIAHPPQSDRSGICRSPPDRPESRHHLQTVSAGPGRYRTGHGQYFCRRAQFERSQRRSRLHDPSRSQLQFLAALSFFPKDTFHQCETGLRSLRRNWGYWDISPPTSDKCLPLSYNHARTLAIAPPDKWRLEPGHPWDTSATSEYKP